MILWVKFGMTRVVNKLSPLKVARLTTPGLHGDGNNLYL